MPFAAGFPDEFPGERVVDAGDVVGLWPSTGNRPPLRGDLTPRRPSRPRPPPGRAPPSPAPGEAPAPSRSSARRAPGRPGSGRSPETPPPAASCPPRPRLRRRRRRHPPRPSSRAAFRRASRTPDPGPRTACGSESRGAAEDGGASDSAAARPRQGRPELSICFLEADQLRRGGGAQFFFQRSGVAPEGPEGECLLPGAVVVEHEPAVEILPERRRGLAPGCRPPRPPCSGPGAPGIRIMTREPRGDAPATPRGPPSPTLRKGPPQETRPARDRGPPDTPRWPRRSVRTSWAACALGLAFLELPEVHLAVRVAIEQIPGPPPADVARIPSHARGRVPTSVATN